MTAQSAATIQQSQYTIRTHRRWAEGWIILGKYNKEDKYGMERMRGSSKE